jgi:FixJ family two-component response regulator
MMTIKSGGRRARMPSPLNGGVRSKLLPSFSATERIDGRGLEVSMRAVPTVFVVDDDEMHRAWLCELIGSAGLDVEAYPGAREFLESCDPAQPGCLVLDIRMPGMSGLQLQEELAARKISLPIILITGYSDVAATVQAMKMGALNVIEKPFGGQAFLDEIHRAIECGAQRRKEEAERAAINARLALLTPREREVLDHVVEGQTTKEIAFSLSLSHKTIETHRTRIMRKMRAESVAELVRMMITLCSE